MKHYKFKEDKNTYELLWQLAHSIHRIDYFLKDIDREQFEREHMRKDAVRCWLIHFSRCVAQLKKSYCNKYSQLPWNVFAPMSNLFIWTFEGDEIWQMVSDCDISPNINKIKWYDFCQIEINKLFEVIQKTKSKKVYERITIADIIGQEYSEIPILYTPPPIDQELGIRTISSVKPVKHRINRKS